MNGICAECHKIIMDSDLKIIINGKQVCCRCACVAINKEGGEK